MSNNGFFLDVYVKLKPYPSLHGNTVLLSIFIYSVRKNGNYRDKIKVSVTSTNHRSKFGIWEGV